MSSQLSANSRYRYRIQGIQVKSTNHIKSKVSARLLVDGEEVHKLSSIKKGQPLAWDEPLDCDGGPDSVLSFQLHEENYFGLKPALKCSIEFAMSEIANEVPAYTIERATNAQSVSFTFFNPPTVLHSDTIVAAFKSIIDFITSVQEPCLTVATTTLASCRIACQKLEEDIEYAKDIEELAVEFAGILNLIHPVGERGYSINLGDTTARVLELLQKASGLIIEYTAMDKTERRGASFVSSCRVRIQNLLEKLRQLKHDFDWIGEALSTLKPVAHSTHHANRECIPGTRITVIGDISEWVEKEAGTDRLLWIRGPSGIGKSSVVASVCRLLEARSMLCASFFCKWDDPELRDPESVIRGVVYGLARHHTGYMRLVASGTRDNLLYECLVALSLMREADQVTTPESTCIVVDALDQCGDIQTRRRLLSYLFNLSVCNPWLKVIVTTCPDQDIQDFFDRISESCVRRMDICNYDASNDIAAFIRERMSSRHGDMFQLNDSHIHSLACSDGGLFIWVDVACRLFLERLDPDQRLEDILRNSVVPDAFPRLDLLYATVLNDYMLNMNEEHGSGRWLGAIVATSLRTPLSIDSLERLLGEYLQPDGLATALNILRILHGDQFNDRHDVLRVYHRSFVEYITTQSRSKDFYVNITKQDAIMSTSCLRIMLSELKFNICELETSYMRNADVPDLESRVRTVIGPHLKYSCLWWIDHITITNTTDVDVALLREFLFSRALFYWIEALSLMNKLNIAISQLTKLIAWIHKLPDPGEFLECVDDAHRFITTSYDAISESAPHLYLSALAFAPSHSTLARRGRAWFPNTPKLIEGAPQRWSPCIQILSRSSSVLCLAPSLDGRMIVTGSEDHTIQLSDAQTNVQLFTPFVGHSSCVWSVAFSPNSCYIASGSQDKTVQLWDAHTGCRVYDPFEGHSGPVLCVAFSPDSRFVISGSHDRALRIWDTDTGAMASEPLVGHSRPVMAVSFSPDGHRIASGSFDKSVRIWDTKTSSSVQFTGHSGWVRAVAFSPDGQRIISGSSDKTIRMWDIEPSSRVYAPIVGHSGMVNCVAFSPDSRYIISGSSDTTVRVWDPYTGAQLYAPLAGHSDHVLSVAFSCDGGRIISCSSDQTVRIWDVQMMAGKGRYALSVRNPDSRPTDLPEGHRTALDPDDQAMLIWKGEPSAEVSMSLVGHSGEVNSVAFSPDGQRIVSGSDDDTLQIWDAETGTEVSAPLVGHSHSVRSVAFSPDGRRIVSGSDDQTVRIWDADTGAKVFAPLVGHSAEVQSVAFSPDGRFIVSGSNDKTVRMWDAETGTQVSAPLIGHSNHVLSVAFSPDGRRIVSGSADTTVRIWDVDHHLAKAGYPFNLSYLLPFMEPSGWLSLPGKPCWLWIPTELRTPTVEAESTPNSSQTIPPSSRVVIDVSRFVHGRRWASVHVAAD